MAGRHKGKFEEGGSPSVQYLNVHGVDLLQLLDQRRMVVRVQYVRERKDEVAPERKGNVGRLKGGERPPQLVDGRLL